MEISRRPALIGVAAGPLFLAGSGPAQAATWKSKWSPQANRGGLGAFEGIEDDRAGSHPGTKHIYVSRNDYRFGHAHPRPGHLDRPAAQRGARHEGGQHEHRHRQR